VCKENIVVGFPADYFSAANTFGKLGKIRCQTSPVLHTVHHRMLWRGSFIPD
jgi:hypothetical protein